jgi:hypothetical protein
MSTSGIARYMHLSQTMDLKRRDRSFQLPGGDVSRTVLMVEKQSATFSAACSSRVISAGF